MWEVTFVGGTIQEFSTNVIAESLYTDMDDNGHTDQLLSRIVDHRSDDLALLNEDAFLPHRLAIDIERKLQKVGFSLLNGWTDL